MLVTVFLFLAQLPFGSRNPDDNKPVDMSDPFEVIVFIVLPILIVILYFLWRRDKKKREEEKNQN